MFRKTFELIFFGATEIENYKTDVYFKDEQGNRYLWRTSTLYTRKLPNFFNYYFKQGDIVKFNATIVGKDNLGNLRLKNLRVIK